MTPAIEQSVAFKSTPAEFFPTLHGFGEAFGRNRQPAKISRKWEENGPRSGE